MSPPRPLSMAAAHPLGGPAAALGAPALVLGISSLVLGAFAPAAFAQEKPWALEYESSLEATSNLQQQFGGVSDFAWRNSLEASYYPASDADNSTLFRLQALNSRYRFNPEYNSTFLIANALTSRRLWNSVFGYGGYQLIYKQLDPATAPGQRDNDLYLGSVVYHPLGSSRLVFHGYQFDYLRAGVNESSYQGHSFFVSFRDVTTERWINTASWRSQLRNLDVVREVEWRNFFSLESVYRLTPWWSLEGNVVFFTSNASRADYTFQGVNAGLFSRFTL